MTKYIQHVLVCALLTTAGSCSVDSDNPGAYVAEIMEWRQWRIERLKQPTGYLNQVGLFWLESGTYSFGSDASNDIVFAGGDNVIGTFVVDDEGVSMQVRPEVEVLHDGAPVDAVRFVADIDGVATLVSQGSLAWSVISRVGRYAVRLRDYDHPFVANFGPLPYFDINPSLRVQARLKRYAEPQIADVGTVIEGLAYQPESPGLVEFSIDGQTYELEAYTVDELLFYVFGDLTNRDDTYGAGRFLYSERPDENGLLVLDFNKSYSPPCAFNDFSTCPVASPRNRLPVRIEAGEKYHAGLFFAASD